MVQLVVLLGLVVHNTLAVNTFALGFAILGMPVQLVRGLSLVANMPKAQELLETNLPVNRHLPAQLLKLECLA